ncbi:MAG: hypothetical protein WC307_00610 [Candidatus Nanoarchaeia archaeon]|jgi:hypothetical protein
MSFISISGLLLIIVSWIIQLTKGKELNKWFLITYIAGVVLLVVEGFMSNLLDMAILNLVSAGVAGLILGKVCYKRVVVKKTTSRKVKRKAKRK